MLRADHLSVVHDDDTVTDYDNVRYTITRHGLQILDAAGAETHVPAHQVLTTHAHTTHTRPTGGTR